MSLNIETPNPHAENINHPNDVYIYFSGGFFVWNINNPDFFVWHCGEMFTFSNDRNAQENVVAFNEWVKTHDR